MRVIIVPDDGQEYVLVPKVNNALPDQDKGWTCVDAAFCRHEGPCSTCEECKQAFNAAHESIIAAAPPVKVVELPKRRITSEGTAIYDLVFNDCLNEIERRAK